jgi:hypothetical protein
MRSELRTGSMAGLVVALAIASGCGDFVESGDGVQRLTVGTEGGTLTLGEFELVVPPHALDHTVTLSVHRETADAPAGPAFTVSATDQVSFGSTPADVTLHYDTAVHTHPADVYAATLVSGVWHQLPRPAGDSGTSGVAHGVTTDVGTFGVIECPAGVCP